MISPPFREIATGFEGGKHVTAEQVDVLHAQLMGYRTKMQQGEQMTDAEALNAQSADRVPSQHSR